jgi:hypothetical protein
MRLWLASHRAYYVLYVVVSAPFAASRQPECRKTPRSEYIIGQTAIAFMRSTSAGCTALTARVVNALQP